jgi:hypothetical protein
MIVGSFLCRTMLETAAAKVQTKTINETANGANNTGMSDP